MAKQSITVIPGDGIGPSIVDSVIKILDKMDCGFDYEYAVAGQTALDQGKELLPQETFDSILKNKVALKGPITTPVGGGFTSVNVALRKKFDLYANVRPARSFPVEKARYDKIDIVVIRENTEGMYSGVGHEINDEGTEAQAISVVSKKGCERVARFAFEYARKNGRKKVTAVHKANILKSTSGLFLSTAREVRKDFQDIEFNDLIVDNCCMQLVMNPHQFDVIVTTNLLGDIISDLCAGLVGGLGLIPGGNIGEEMAIFEAVHGSAPDIAAKNIANPSALILASAMMLEFLKMNDKALEIRQVLYQTIRDKDHLTPDLGGQASTAEFTQAILSRA